MRFKYWSIALALLVVAPRVVDAQAFVGPNVEWSYWSFPSDQKDFNGNTFGIGGQYLMPGLRAGYLFPDGSLAVLADAGVQVERLGALEYTNILVEPGLVYAFSGEGATSPYVGVSAGWYHVKLSTGFTTPVIGASVGLRHRVAAGHGFIRGEVRYDRLTNTNSGGAIMPENMIGIRLGPICSFRASSA